MRYTEEVTQRMSSISASLKNHESTVDAKLLEAYSIPPVLYDIRGFLILTFAYQSTLWSQIAFFGKNIGKRHLDVAVGTCTLLYLTLKWRKFRKKTEGEVIAIDYVPSMLAGGRKFFRNNPHVTLEVGDAMHLTFADNSFDTVNIANSVHCISDVDAAFRETFRVLKPQGRFAANVLLYPQGIFPFKQIAGAINRWGIKKGILATPYEREDVRARLVASGFTILDESVSGNCYNVLAAKP